MVKGEMGLKKKNCLLVFVRTNSIAQGANQGKTWYQSAQIKNSYSLFCQIGIIFTHLK